MRKVQRCSLASLASLALSDFMARCAAGVTVRCVRLANCRFFSPGLVILTRAEHEVTSIGGCHLADLPTGF